MTAAWTTLRALLAAAAVVLSLVPPASAGGPTSVRLTSPGETVSLSYTEADYALLGEILGITQTTPEDAGGSHVSGPAITATWLLHDIDPWRIDWIYLDAEGGPWVETQVMDFGTGEISDGPVFWHRPQRGTELALLLERLLPAAAVPEPSVGGSGAWWGMGDVVLGVLRLQGWLAGQTRSTSA